MSLNKQMVVQFYNVKGITYRDVTSARTCNKVAVMTIMSTNRKDKNA
jgi:hypothetical protein